MDDAGMMRYLVGKYGLTELVAMLRTTAANEQGSASSSSITSQKGANHLVFEANPSPISFSDASSITGSLYSTCSDASSFHSQHVAQSPAPTNNVVGGQARAIGRKVVRRAAAASKRSNLGALGGAWGTKKQEPFECPFCRERGITVEIKRKNDLKRHFHEFHTNHSIWTCSIPNCGTSFEWKSAYTNHLKSVHSGVGPLPDDVMAKTCPQVVYACGFVDCKRIFEAQSDEDADKKAHEYFAHVADHFDGDGLTHRDWSYSARFRNLMRQSPVDEAWKRRIKTSSESPAWLALSSFTLRKMLECRHIGDVNQLIQVASALGHSAEGPKPTLPPGFFIPLRHSCPMAAVNHRSDGLGHQQQDHNSSHSSSLDIPDFSPFETPLPTFPKLEEDATSLSKMSMMPAPLNFTAQPLPPHAGAWTTSSHDSIALSTTSQDLSNTSFLFLDSDDTMSAGSHLSNVPRAPSYSVNYWTNLLQNGYATLEQQHNLQQQQNHQQQQQHHQNQSQQQQHHHHHQQQQQQQHHYQQHLAHQQEPQLYQQQQHHQGQHQDPPIHSDQQSTTAGPQKRRWSMRTTSSGKTVVPIRTAVPVMPDSRPPSSIISSVFQYH